MSSKELRRKTVMDEVVGGRRKLRSAAEVFRSATGSVVECINATGSKETRD